MLCPNCYLRKEAENFVLLAAEPGFMVSAATRWSRSLPRSRSQLQMGTRRWPIIFRNKSGLVNVVTGSPLARAVTPTWFLFGSPHVQPSLGPMLEDCSSVSIFPVWMCNSLHFLRYVVL